MSAAPFLVEGAGAPAQPDAPTPYEFIQAWSIENVGSGVPSPEKLRDVQQALAAIEEFLIEPIAKALEYVPELFDAQLDRASIPVPEHARPVSYADIGRLVEFTDTLRENCNSLLDVLAEITLLTHEDLLALAAGYPADGTRGTPEVAARLRRFHGLA